MFYYEYELHILKSLKSKEVNNVHYNENEYL